MIEALRHSRRDELIMLTRRHLKPAEQAYVRAYRQRFGDGGAGALSQKNPARPGRAGSISHSDYNER